MRAGDVKILTVGLKPVTYQVYCPVDDYKGKGMSLAVCRAIASEGMAAPAGGIGRRGLEHWLREPDLASGNGMYRMAM